MIGGSVALAAAIAAWELGPWPATVHAPLAHLALEVAAGMVAAIAAVLLFVRARQERRRRDVALACAVAMLATSHLLLTALPTALGDGRLPAFAPWAVMATHLSAGAVFVACLVLPDRVLRPRAIPVAGALLAATIAAITAGAALAAPATPPAAEGGTRFLHLLGAAILVAAAVSAARRGAGDAFIAWIATGTVLAALGRVLFTVHPTFLTEYVGPGDAVRLLAHAAMLAGAAGEISRYWHELAASAVAAERGRIARDLHDGVAQDLAFIVRRSAVDDAELRAAAHRALAGTRQAIDALRDAEPLDLRHAVSGAICAAAARVRVATELHVDPGIRATADEVEAISRIAAEAVANAGRHGGARRVRVEVTARPGLRLTVRDDGAGFGGAPAERAGWGLLGMHEHAGAVGGRLCVRSGRRRGTLVELTVP